MRIPIIGRTPKPLKEGFGVLILEEIRCGNPHLLRQFTDESTRGSARNKAEPRGSPAMMIAAAVSP